jgi:DNA polymerase-3 subunit delta'
MVLTSADNATTPHQYTTPPHIGYRTVSKSHKKRKEIPPHNWPVYGHDWAVDYLRKAMLNQRIRHAYLIIGTANIGKDTLAHAFAMALNCTYDDLLARPCLECRSCHLAISGNHPDMLYSETDESTGTLKIDAIRQVTRLLALKPYDARYRIAIFRDFDHAQKQAQDAMLKTLEEPPPQSILLLLAESYEEIQPTIISRCQLIRLQPVATPAIQEALLREEASEEQATLLARLSSGRIGWALQALRDPDVLAKRDEDLNLLVEALSGKRSKRFAIAESLFEHTRKGREGKAEVLDLLQRWQTFLRDVMLLSLESPVKPANSDRHLEIQQIVQRVQPDEARAAVEATQKAIRVITNTNAHVRMVLEVMMLDYPGL